jgi:hypothetical protein
MISLRILQKFIDRYSRTTDQTTECPNGQFFVPRNRQIRMDAGFDHDYMAANLANYPPA